MKCLLLDTETTGLDNKKDRIIELGYMFTDSMFNPIRAGEAHLVRDESYPEVTDEITKITGISQQMLLDQAKAPLAVFSMFSNEILSMEPDVIVAYNSPFDMGMLKEEIERNKFDMFAGIEAFLKLPVICAMSDVESNYDFKCWKLSHLALDKGVAIDPKELHRALGDVELMRRMLVSTNTNAQEIIAYQNEPWITVRAVTTKPWEDDGKSTNEAKKRGYSWETAKGDPERKVHTKAWVKRIKEKKFAEEEKLATFPVRIIRPET